MEWEWKYLVWSAIFLIPGLVFLLAWKKSSCSYRLPPGPPGLPVIGNMLDLGAFPHQTIAEMKNKYGSVIWLRIGSVSTMVILSAKAAAELFKNHDVSFADRTVIDVMKVQGYYKGSLAFAPYGSYWRVLRRICTVELFVHKRINETVPKDTQVFVNVWAIGRDPESWDDPLSFKPERFLGSNIDFKGQDFEFLPFGAGRRICVGLPLGNRMLHFILGSLLHAFDWELACNVTSQYVDMKERMGMVVSKSEPLKAIPGRIVA